MTVKKRKLNKVIFNHGDIIFPCFNTLSKLLTENREKSKQRKV